MLDNRECPLRKLMEDALTRVEHVSSDHSNGEAATPLATVLGMSRGIAGRVLRAQACDEGYTEIWIRVSGEPDLIESFEAAMKKSEGIAFQKIFSNKFNTIYRIVVERSKCPCAESSSCPLLSPVPGAMVKSTIVTPYGLLCELIVAKSKALSRLRENGCHVILSHEINEYDYMLTEKQELAIIYAYMMGYYSFPRKISLKELASKLGLSVSTLAELIRKAEAKVIEAFIRHELPHYLVGITLSKAFYKDLVENKFNNSKERKAVKPNASS